jgi:hypothetical protein
MKTYSDFKSFSKDQAYWERNQLVAALSKIYPSSLGKHPLSDKTWDKEWRNIVYITIPVKRINHVFPTGPECIITPMQLSWHIHNSDLDQFTHLKRGKEKWDGHNTNEKYHRLRFIDIPEPKKWYQFWK